MDSARPSENCLPSYVRRCALDIRGHTLGVLTTWYSLPHTLGNFLSPSSTAPLHLRGSVPVCTCVSRHASSIYIHISVHVSRNGFAQREATEAAPVSVACIDEDAIQRKEKEKKKKEGWLV